MGTNAPKGNECTICKHYGRKTDDPKQLEVEKLYDEGEVVTQVKLCRTHAVSLFKLGQRKFLIEHYQILNEVVNSDEPEFIDLLDKTYRNNVDKIF